MAKSLKELLEENLKESSNEEVLELELDKIKPNPYQPRDFFDASKIDELALSIKEHGVIQPIIVKPVGNHYLIIAGERRYRASLKLGLKTIPAIVRTYEKTKMIELALIENLQRENLSPIEEATAYVSMMKELGYNQTEVAMKVGKSRSYVTNMIGILNLPQEVLGLLKVGKLSFGHARVLSKLKDDSKICDLAYKVVTEQLSVREIEVLAKKYEKKNEVRNKRDSERVIYNKILNNRKIKIVGDKNKITIKVSDGSIEDIMDWLLKEIK